MWDKIQKKLEEKGMSVYRLGKLTGIPGSTLRNYRNGHEPSFSNVVKIAEVLNVELDYFK